MFQVYEPRPESCALVRRDIRAFLTVAGLLDETVEIALMVASELASNAVDHAGTSFRVLVHLTDRCLRIEVTDGSTALPVLQPLDTSALRGRGLQMIDHLATSWTYAIVRDGKTVVAEMAVAAG